MYTALYRKLRPQSFADVVDQVHIVRTLKNQIASGRVGHAYLFCGVRGTGKTSCAKIFARAVNCTDSTDGEACGTCTSCIDIGLNRSMDAIEIDAASNNGVDNIRELREEVRYPPQGKYKVYIIDEVHMFSNSAFNALLKTLEEPPPQVIFILATTDPQKIPATIHSRVMRFDFHRISAEGMRAALAGYMRDEGISITPDALDYIVRISDGGMRDALSLLDRLAGLYFGQEIALENALEVTGSVSRDIFVQMHNALEQKNVQDIFGIIENISSLGRDFAQFTEEFLAYLRDVMIETAKTNPAKLSAITGMVSHFAGALRNIKQSGRLSLEIACIEQIHADSKALATQSIQNAIPADTVQNHSVAPQNMLPTPQLSTANPPVEIENSKNLPQETVKPAQSQGQDTIHAALADWNNFCLKNPMILMGIKVATLDDNVLYMIYPDGNTIAKGSLEKNAQALKQELNETYGGNFDIAVKSGKEFRTLHEEKFGKDQELERLQEKINHEITVTY